MSAIIQQAVLMAALASHTCAEAPDLLKMEGAYDKGCGV